MPKHSSSPKSITPASPAPRKRAAGARTATPEEPAVEAAALDDLRVRIQNCDLMPGDKLKFEELRERYQTSVGTLREALNALESEGLVISEKNRGFQVAPVSVAELVDITELRVELQRKALQLSIEHGDDEWEARIVTAWHLLSIIQASRKDSAVFDAVWAKRHADFHAALLQACPSRWTLRFCAQLYNLAQRYQRLAVKYRAGSPSRGFKDHEQLVKLCLNRDVERACDVMEAHVRGTTDSILRGVPAFSSALP
ncbi:MAG: GntR family transcriptional regulator [Pseudomonadota bacterium]